jgi:predicted lipoprotein
MQKIVKYILLLLAVGLVAYKSVYIKKLSEVKKKTNEKFDAVAYSKKLWDERLPAKLDSAIELTALIKAIEANPATAFASYSNAIGIGNYRYSLVKVAGVATVIGEDEIAVQVNHADSLLIAILATEYIYGNAIRDASGLVDIIDFTNTADLNSISEELNKTVRTLVLPPFKKLVKQGDKIEITAAVEFNKEHISFGNLELIPVRLKIVQ